MSKTIYSSNPERFVGRNLLPWCILADLLKHRSLIATVTERDFRSAYQASYLGLSWQVILPLIMLSIFYLVFGEILGGRFSSNPNETHLEYALALFVGLGFFNFLAQTINTATTLMTSSVTYVKTLAFPLEILPVTAVLNALLTLAITLVLAVLVLAVVGGQLYWSAVAALFYVACAFLMALGISWGLSALAVFIRDVSAITSPLTLILMFMCPIFYPESMVPAKIKWIIHVNPLALIIEDARRCMLYGDWPSGASVGGLFVVSLLIAVFGYFFFMKSKSAFADVM
jgi:lipopolysaccharide transport system permease protein